MSHPTQPPTPRWRRPWTVTVAIGALLGTAAVLLAQAAAVLYDLVNYGKLVDLAGELTHASAADIGTEKSQSDTSDATTLLVVLIGVLVLLLAAAGVRRASNRARLLTLLTSGLLLVGCGATLAVDNLFAPPTSVLQHEAIRLQDASYPGWVNLAELAGLLIYPLLLGAFVLLLLPASNRYFRSPQPIYLVPAD
ncbi:hypothetical protein GCM10023322_00900 [Rugosimonospora acidiphila]|uniref:DUF2567 domain-containing protein n=1 Tax=Rugosimonospora acidiphila TaxID=556531 RepID=A0ABP9RHI8_9ACTN